MNRTFRALRVRNYRLWFTGQLVSVTGGAMQQVAQAWLVVSLTGSGVALGTAVGLQTLPMLLFGIWGGAAADRFDKRRILFGTQLAGATLAATMGTLVATGAIELWMIYVFAFLLGCVHAVDMPTRHAFVIEMVGPDDLTNAVGLNSAGFNVGRLLGPATSGVLIATVGIEASFLANAGTYLASIAALRAMRPEELFHRTDDQRQPGQVLDGLRFVWNTPALRKVLIMVAVVGGVGFNFGVTLPLLAREVFGGGPRLFGTLSSLAGLGAVIGALAAARRVGPSMRLLATAAAAFGCLLLAVAVSPGPVVAGAVLVAVGGALVSLLNTANATMQLGAPAAVRGRVMAVYSLVFLGSAPLGAPFVGWIAELWGPRVAVAFGGLATLCILALLVARGLLAEGSSSSTSSPSATPGPAAGDAASIPAPVGLTGDVEAA